ncbi:MAG: ATP-binding protein [Polyangiales bacterium]
MNLEELGTRRRRTWPLVPPAPIAVVVLGVAIAAIIGAIGVVRLQRQGAASAAGRAHLLATTVAARLGEIPDAARHDLLDRASRRGSAAIWLVESGGAVVEEVSNALVPIDLPGTSVQGPGDIESTRGSARYYAAEVPPAPLVAGAPTKPKPLTVIVAVDVPDPPEGVRALISALFTLTALLIGIAATVAYAVARDVNLDVDDLGVRIREIASRGRDTADRAQDIVPVQALDEVGALAAAFNALVERFALAERTYADALARMEEIDRERSTFLATVSHELRSPLNAILGFADILLSEVDGPLVAEAREEVAVIKQSGLHLLGLINDILELSAIASGQLRLNRNAVDLVPIAEEVVREAMGARGEKPVELRLGGASKLLAHVDPRRVRQILTNLVGNAVKFTPKGEVVVTLEADAHYATLRVRDTGPGIPAQDRETIFAEYRQAGDHRARRRGTGLGLAIARRLAMMHGGTIRLESEVGVGSTFVLRLPVRGSESTGPVLLADDSGGFVARPLA